MSSTADDGARSDGDAAQPNDDLRSRMRLRLSQTQSHAQRVEAAGAAGAASTARPAGASSSAASSTGVRDRGSNREVSQMVWNSVLESLSGTPASPTSAATPLTVAPLATPAPAIIPEAVAAPPAPVAEAAEIPITVVTAEAAENHAIAQLFSGASTPTALHTGSAAGPSTGETTGQTAGSVPARTILATDMGPIVPAMPVLAPPSRATPPPRVTASAAGNEVDAAAAAPAGSRKAKKAAKANQVAPVMIQPTRSLQQRKKRHPIRSFLTFVLVVGLLGGAGFVGWYKFLRNHVVWADELRPSATFVEQTVHRSFDETVPVKTLSVPEYEVKLGLAVLARLDGATEAEADSRTPSGASPTAAPEAALLTLRAVGLVGASPPPGQVGHLVAASMTSFYQSSDHTIYRLAGDGAAFEVDMIRSMTMAILDQDIDFATTMSTLDDAQRSGFQARIDGVVADVTAAKFQADPNLRDSYGFEIQTRNTAAGIGDGNVPVYLSSVLTSAAHGDSDFAAGSADSPLSGLSPPPSDAPIFDPTRDPSAAAVVVPAASDGQTTRVLGVEFWFDALLPALGVDDARAAALLWAGESSTTTLVNGQACLSSTIAAATAADADALLAALTRWTQSRPASSTATAEAGTDASLPTVVVSVCEPTEGVVAPTATPTDLAALFVRPAAERAVLQRVGELGLAPTPTTNACVVAAYRHGALPGFSTDSADPGLVAALTNVVSFCRTG